MNRWETSVKYCCLVLNIPQRLRKSPYRVENGLLRVFILNLLNVTMDKFFMDQTQTLLNIPFHLSISVPFMDQTNFVLNIPIYVSMFFPFSAPPRWMKRRSVRFSTISAPFSQPWRIFSSPPHDSGCKHEDLKWSWIFKSTDFRHCPNRHSAKNWPLHISTAVDGSSRCSDRFREYRRTFLRETKKYSKNWNILSLNLRRESSTNWKFIATNPYPPN